MTIIVAKLLNILYNLVFISTFEPNGSIAKSVESVESVERWRRLARNLLGTGNVGYR